MNLIFPQKLFWKESELIWWKYVESKKEKQEEFEKINDDMKCLQTAKTIHVLKISAKCENPTSESASKGTHEYLLVLTNEY